MFSDWAARRCGAFPPDRMPLPMWRPSRVTASTVQEEGRFWISATPVPGGTALRLNVISYLTDESTIDALLDTLPELGNRAEGMIF